jgi:hypothetical protein
MPKDVPFWMASADRIQIEADKKQMNGFFGNVLVPMVDIRGNTVNRTGLQNKFMARHRVMIGCASGLITKLPVPVEMRTHMATLGMSGFPTIDDVRNYPVHFGCPETRDHSVLVK